MSANPDDLNERRTVSQRRNFFEYLFLKFNTFYESVFFAIGRQLGTRPVVFILASIVLTGVCSLGFLRPNSIKDSDTLFIPTDSKSVRDRDILAKRLPINYDEYYLHQDYDLGIYGEVIFTTKNYINVARPNIRNELKRIYALIQNVNVTYQNQTYFYADLCAKRENQCVTEGEVFFRESFWQRLADHQLENYIANDLYTDDDGIAHLLPFIFGRNLTIDFQKNTLFTRVLKLRFNLRRTKTVDGNTVDITEISRMWEQAFLEFFQHFKSIMVDSMYSVSTSIDQELNKNIYLDVVLVALTFTIMIIVATLFLSVRSPFAQSPAHLSGVGVLATMLGLVSGFGFCLLIGVPSCSLVLVTPFLVIGVGMDDMFLIFSAYRRTKSLETTTQRLAETFRICGSGITITSLTNILAFLAGATTNFYGIRLFCFYTSASVAFCYIYQITLFGSCIALYNDCINNNRHTLIVCLVDRTASANNQKRRRRHRQQCVPLKEMFVYITKPLFSTCGQIIVCVIFVIYSILAIYGASHMQDGMKLGQLLNDKSYAKLYFDTLDREFELFPLVQFVILEPIPYWRNDYMQRIKDLVIQSKQLDGMAHKFEISWFSLIGYSGHQHPLDNGSQFMDTVQGFVNLFPPFANDLLFNTTHLLASRFYLKFGRIYYNSNDGHLINQLRALAAQSNLPIKVYSSLFKYYEQMYEVIPNIVQTFLIAVEAMYIATLLIIPDLKSVLIIMSTMMLILTSLVATLHLWGISASSVMMIELVMSVGFCSDFCVHIVHAFLTATGTRKERAQKALINMGMPILCASLSSMIGVAFLGFAQSYLFRTFFATIVTIMILGTVHALFFLPVILSVIGSHWPSHMANKQQPESHALQITSAINGDALVNGHLTGENATKREQLHRGANTIEEEEGDQLIGLPTIKTAS